MANLMVGQAEVTLQDALNFMHSTSAVTLNGSEVLSLGMIVEDLLGPNSLTKEVVNTELLSIKNKLEAAGVKFV
jgi:hypothetical protein